MLTRVNTMPATTFVQRLMLDGRINDRNIMSAGMMTTTAAVRSIADAAEGNYEWAGVTDTPGQHVAVYFLHKWCSPAFELRQGPVLDSMELTVMLPYLAQNLQLDWDKAWSQAETLSEL